MSVEKFTKGKTRTIGDFHYEDACFIFGKPLTDAYYEGLKRPPGKKTVRIVEINHETNTVTVRSQ